MKNSIVASISLLLLFFACNQSPFVQGKEYYNHLCSNCHMEDGTGLKKVIPSLANSEYLKLNQESLPCLIRNGMETPEDSTLFMPANRNLTAFEISNIINYINSSWGNTTEIQHINQIQERLHSCP